MKQYPVFIGLIILAATAPASADFGVREEKQSVTVQIDWQSYELQGRLFRPEVEGRRPLVVLAHGTCGKRCRRRGDGYMHPLARLFARSGYVAYAFNRLGYGGSEGYLGERDRHHESNSGCNTQDYEMAGRLVAQQIRPVIAELVKAPFVDPGRVVVYGHSGGGLGAIALTKKGAPGLRGVISGAGARGGTCAKGEYLGGHFYNENMTAAYQVFARGSATPVLMLFAENDPRTARAKSWRNAYAAAGGSVELVVIPPQPRSGHNIKRWDPADWVPPASRFLEGLGLPALEN